MTEDQEASPEVESPAFAERCRVAVAAVQQDLDRTGLSQFRLRTALRGFEIYVGLPSGDTSGEFPHEGLTPEMDNEDLRAAAAANAISALLIIEGIRWPRCSEHPTKYMQAGYQPGETEHALHHAAWWWCRTITPTSKPHPVSAIGDLQTNQIVTPYSRPGT